MLSSSARAWSHAEGGHELNERRRVSEGLERQRNGGTPDPTRVGEPPTLIQKSQKPDWYATVGAVLDVVGDDVGVFDFLDLSAFFVFAADFKGVFAVHEKI